ncbi:jg1079, partial [Pararge aegeria aegeria]
MNGPRMPVPRNTSNDPRLPTPPSSDSGENQVFCGCNKEARLLTVRKQGPNL